MIARVQSFLLQGIEAHPCEVEVDLNEAVGTGSEQARAVVVGLPDAAVKESFERMRAAIENSGYAFPMGRVVINLAPADVRKEGPLYDLPIAIGVLMSAGVLSRTSTRRAYSGAGAAGRARPSAGGSGADAAGDGDEKFEFDPRQYLFAGELALDGRLRPVRGVIAMATLAAAKGAKGVVVPHENVSEAALVPGIEAIGVRTLTEVVGIIAGDIEARPAPAVDVAAMLATAAASVDFGDVRGQEAVKRAIVVAAAGGHNVLRCGPTDGHRQLVRAMGNRKVLVRV